MGFLTVMRRPGESIRLTIDPAVDAEKLLHHLLRDGITISLGAVNGSQLKLSVEAPKEVLIMRTELLRRDDD